MKYYTICYPGEHGQHIQETFSEYQVLQSYFDYWYGQMRKVGKLDEVNIENCIQDWVVGHWAWDSDKVGNQIKATTNNDFEEFNLDREADRLRDIDPSCC